MSDETKTTAAPTRGDLDAGLVARLASQRARFRDAATQSEAKLKDAHKELERLRAEVTELKGKADTSASAKRVLELEGVIRERNHRDKFAELALARGATAKTLADLYTLSGYRPEGDAIDENAIALLIDQQKADRPYLFGMQANGQAPPPPPRPGVASGQGSPEHGAPVVVDSSDPRMSDVKYQFANFDRISQAALDRMNRGEI